MAFGGAPSACQIARVKLILKVQEHLVEIIFLLLCGGIKSKIFFLWLGGLCLPQTIEGPWIATFNPLPQASTRTSTFSA
jgi:hypothetical protein